MPIDKEPSYAAWRISFQSSEQAAQAAYKMWQLEAAKNEARIAEEARRNQGAQVYQPAPYWLNPEFKMPVPTCGTVKD